MPEFRYSPLVSVVLPAWNTNFLHLRAAVDSVLAQDYPHWELCAVNDGSSDSRVADLLEAFAARDSRVRVRHRPVSGGTVAASNDALAMATGEFVAFLDHDDTLAPDALTEIVAAVNERPGADLLYSDEDKLAPDGTYGETFFKPDWSPDYLRGCMYLGHLCVYRRALVASLGGLRDEAEGSQDWDLALRVSEVTDRIHHVRKVLYHWRVAAGSTSGGADNKDYAVTSARRVVGDHLHRRGTPGACEEQKNFPGWFHSAYEIAGDPLVSIVIPAGGGRRIIRGRATPVVENCIRSILDRTTYENYEIVCVLDTANADEVRDSLVAAVGPGHFRSFGGAAARIRFLEVPRPFNFSTKVNRGAIAAKGEHLVLLNDDTEVISAGWLSAMLGLSQQPDVGAVGAKLFFGDGRIQHSGVVVLAGLPGHINYGADGDSPGYFGNLILDCNYVAVTGACLMTRKDLYERVGGLSVQFPLNYGDVDYCLKLRRLGYRSVCTPAAQLYHYEASTRQAVVTDEELRLFRELWSDLPADDPYFPPALISSLVS